EVAEQVPQVSALEVESLEAASGTPWPRPEATREAPGASLRAPRPPGVETGPRMPETVVGAPLFGVLEDVVGLLDLLEALLGGLIARIDVGVELPGQTPVGLLDVGLRGALGDAQDLVELAFGHSARGL